MYRLLKQEGRARRGELATLHGTVQTPAFMNVATSAAIKGGISSHDLEGCTARWSSAIPTTSTSAPGIG